MPQFCSVVGCHNTSNTPDAKFGKKKVYRLPKILTTQGEQTESLSRERRQRWIQAIRRDDLNVKSGDVPYDNDHVRVCSDHFITGKWRFVHKLICLLTLAYCIVLGNQLYILINML